MENLLENEEERIENEELNEIVVDGEEQQPQRPPGNAAITKSRRRPPETRRQQLSNGDGRNRDEIEREREIESLRERLESER